MPDLRRLLLSCAAMLVLGVAAGLVWVQLAQPADWEVRDNGMVLTEAASTRQFSVALTFIAVGFVTSFVGGALAGWALPRLEWRLTPFVIVLTIAGSIVAWRLGVWLGPPDPTSVPGTEVGDRIPARLAVDGPAPFLAWPIAGLAGLLVVTWLSGRRR